MDRPEVPVEPTKGRRPTRDARASFSAEYVYSQWWKLSVMRELSKWMVVEIRGEIEDFKWNIKCVEIFKVCSGFCTNFTVERFRCDLVVWVEK